MTDKNTNSEKKNQARIKAIETEIDQLVYNLYRLTEEEITIVENSGK